MIKFSKINVSHAVYNVIQEILVMSSGSLNSDMERY